MNNKLSDFISNLLNKYIGNYCIVQDELLRIALLKIICYFKEIEFGLNIKSNKIVNKILYIMSYELIKTLSNKDIKILYYNNIYKLLNKSIILNNNEFIDYIIILKNIMNSCNNINNIIKDIVELKSKINKLQATFEQVYLLSIVKLKMHFDIDLNKIFDDNKKDLHNRGLSLSKYFVNNNKTTLILLDGHGRMINAFLNCFNFQYKIKIITCDSHLPTYLWHCLLFSKKYINTKFYNLYENIFNISSKNNYKNILVNDIKIFNGRINFSINNNLFYYNFCGIKESISDIKHLFKNHNKFFISYSSARNGIYSASKILKYIYKYNLKCKFITNRINFQTLFIGKKNNKQKYLVEYVRQLRNLKNKCRKTTKLINQKALNKLYVNVLQKFIQF